MNRYLCPQCGGKMDICEHNTMFECPYCGFRQINDPNEDRYLRELKDKAEAEYRVGRYDSAAKLYQSAAAHKADSDIDWMLLLCAYGVEYVDGNNGKKCMICHRFSYTPVGQTREYNDLLKHTQNPLLSEWYQSEAKKIDDIQLLIRNWFNEPCDILICAVDNEDDKRTLEGSHARELSYRLSQEGYRVFYLPESIPDDQILHEDAWNQAAVFSSRFCFVIGYSSNHFNVIEKSWQPFLERSKSEEGLYIIPYYNNVHMEFSDLPKPLHSFQARYAPKDGISDLVDYVCSAMPKARKNNYSVTVKALLKRISFFFEDGEFNRVEPYCQRILAENPKVAEVYIIRLMLRLGVHNEESLSNVSIDLSKDSDFIQALQLADDEYRKRLFSYQDNISYRKLKEKISLFSQHVKKQGFISLEKNFNEASVEINKLSYHPQIDTLHNLLNEQKSECIYNEALSKKQQLTTFKDRNDITDLQEIRDAAFKLFEEIPGYKDAEKQKHKVEELYQEKIYYFATSYQKEILNCSEEGIDFICSQAKELFLSIKDFRDASEQYHHCDTVVLERHYRDALIIQAEAIESKDIRKGKESANRFKNLSKYKDSKEQEKKSLELVEYVEANAQIKQEKARLKETEKVLGHMQEEATIQKCWKSLLLLVWIFDIIRTIILFNSEALKGRMDSIIEYIFLGPFYSLGGAIYMKIESEYLFVTVFVISLILSMAMLKTVDRTNDFLEILGWSFVCTYVSLIGSVAISIKALYDNSTSYYAGNVKRGVTIPTLNKSIEQLNEKIKGIEDRIDYLTQRLGL